MPTRSTSEHRYNSSGSSLLHPRSLDEFLYQVVKIINEIDGQVIEPLRNAGYTDGRWLLNQVSKILGLDSDVISDLLKMASADYGSVGTFQPIDGFSRLKEYAVPIQWFSRRENVILESFKVYLALLLLEKQSSCSDIARKYAEIFPEGNSSSDTILLVLNSGEHGIIPARPNETYALSEWGDIVSDSVLDDTATGIIEGIHSETGTPRCPECAEPTVFKTARHGEHAGKTFWGCKNFPSCKGLIGIQNLNIIVPNLPTQHQEALKWFAVMTGEETDWPTKMQDGTILATKAKGIYKPAWTDYALSVRQNFNDLYEDKDPILHQEGAWSYQYSQENIDPNKRDNEYTNRGLMECIKDQVPVGVFRQVKEKPGPRYQILGLARVTGWKEGFFSLEGIPSDEYLEAAESVPDVTLLSTEISEGVDRAEDLISSLRISLIAGPELRGNHLDRVVSFGDRYTIGDLKEFLESGTGHGEIADTFNTPTRAKNAEAAIQRTQQTVSNWVNGEHRNPDFKWIVPLDYIPNDPNDHRLSKYIIAHWPELVIEGDMKWLMWLNLELAAYVKKMKYEELNLIKHGLRMISEDVLGERIAGPWLPNYPESLAILPIFALCGYMPSIKELNILKQIHFRGYTNIGSLVPFSPKIFDSIRNTSTIRLSDCRNHLYK